MTETPPAPASAEALRAEILKRYGGLSKRLQQIGRYVLEDPNAMALETLAVIAERCAVQPSAIVRFAQTFGFEGATQMQRLFRDRLLSNQAALGYSERVRQFSAAVSQRAEQGSGRLLSEFIDGNSLALQNLAQTVSDVEVSAAVDLIDGAETVFVAGFRRSFPVASYLAYSLQQAGKRTLFVDGIGGMERQQIGTIAPSDLLIAVSYQPYAEETALAVRTAAERRARILSITDSPVSPIAKPADVTLQVREAEIRAFRSLSASLCLAQALVIGFAFQASQPAKGGRRRRALEERS